MKYLGANKGTESNQHHGQRKLLLVEIDFLLDWFTHPRRDKTRTTLIVYAGAAGGHHLETLCNYFEKENCTWLLYDTTPFECWTNKRTPDKVQKICRFFDVAEARRLYDANKTYDILFISDIRSAVPDFALHFQGQKEADDMRVENEILKELSLQQTWIFEMQCKYAIMKFRLPYQYDYASHQNVTELKYVKGEIRIQPWARKNSTECRLVVKEDDIRDKNQEIYDCVAYEEIMCWVNHQQRPHGLDQFLDDMIMNRLNAYLI